MSNNYETALTKLWIDQDSEFWDSIDTDDLEDEIKMWLEGFTFHLDGLERDLFRSAIDKVDVAAIVDEMEIERKL